MARAVLRAGSNDVSLADEPPASETGHTIVVRGDVVLDERLVAGMLASHDAVLHIDSLGPVAANVASERAKSIAAVLYGETTSDRLTDVRTVRPNDITSFYLPKLRKHEPPFAYLATEENTREIEWKTFGASYKGLTDLVTKWVWPVPAAAVTRWCAKRRITPNVVTIVSWMLAIETTWLFANAQFGLGLLAAWCMTFLDTVDGKLARVTLTSSKLGDVLDHGLDLLHPPFWWFAWAFGAGLASSVAMTIVVGGYVIGRLLEGAFLALFKFEMHSWRPIDGLFRTITARRNPNLILFTVAALAGRPDLGLVMVAGWTALSLSFHSARLLRGLRARSRGESLTPWDAQPITAGTPQ